MFVAISEKELKLKTNKLFNRSYLNTRYREGNNKQLNEVIDIIGIINNKCVILIESKLESEQKILNIYNAINQLEQDFLNAEKESDIKIRNSLDKFYQSENRYKKQCAKAKMQLQGAEKTVSTLPIYEDCSFENACKAIKIRPHAAKIHKVAILPVGDEVRNFYDGCYNSKIKNPSTNFMNISNTFEAGRNPLSFIHDKHEFIHYICSNGLNEITNRLSNKNINDFLQFRELILCSGHDIVCSGENLIIDLFLDLDAGQYNSAKLIYDRFEKRINKCLRKIDNNFPPPVARILLDDYIFGSSKNRSKNDNIAILGLSKSSSEPDYELFDAVVYFKSFILEKLPVFKDKINVAQHNYKNAKNI